MADYVGARLAARKAWNRACWDVRTAELRHGVGSQEWVSACKAEKQAQDAYYAAASSERAHSQF